jgi:enamine deaminase RidA (YjgF/YER057c/UK114 family)
MTADPHSSSQVLSPAGWLRPSGYANGIVASGRHVVLAGQIGWNPATCVLEHDDFAAQARQALTNIVTLLLEAGAVPADLVRLTWYITNRAEYADARAAIGKAYREVIGRHYPAMSVVIVAGLLDVGAKVEIEATAVLRALP